MPLKNSKNLPDRFLSLHGFKIDWGKVKGQEEYDEEKGGLQDPGREKPYSFVPCGMGWVLHPY
jgi:hypothetical protein